MTKYVCCGPGFAPEPAEGAYRALSDHSWIRRAALWRREKSPQGQQMHLYFTCNRRTINSFIHLLFISGNTAHRNNTQTQPDIQIDTIKQTDGSRHLY